MCERFFKSKNLFNVIVFSYFVFFFKKKIRISLHIRTWHMCVTWNKNQNTKLHTGTKVEIMKREIKRNTWNHITWQNMFVFNVSVFKVLIPEFFLNLFSKIKESALNVVKNYLRTPLTQEKIHKVHKHIQALVITLSNSTVVLCCFIKY